MPDNLCRFFRRNSDGTWTTTGPMLINNGPLSTGLRKGQTLAPGDIRAGREVVQWLEQNCFFH